jgi:hypothetical protein
MATLVDGQLLAEGEMLQGQVTTVFEDGNEYGNEGSKARSIKPTVAGARKEVQCLLKIGVLARHNRNFGEGQIWLGARDGQSYARLPRFFALALYTLLKIELLTVPVLSENVSCSMPIERRMLKCTFDRRVSPFRQ